MGNNAIYSVSNWFLTLILVFMNTFVVSQTQNCEVLASIRLTENQTDMTYSYQTLKIFQNYSAKGITVNLTELFLDKLRTTNVNNIHPIYLSDVEHSWPFAIKEYPSADASSSFYVLTAPLPLDREFICGTSKRRQIARTCCANNQQPANYGDLISDINTPCCVILSLTAGKKGTSFIRIDIEDVNDHAPVFMSTGPYVGLAPKTATFENLVIAVSELTPVGTWIALPCAVDMDEGANASIQYFINMEMPEDEFLQTFELTSNRHLNKNHRDGSDEFDLMGCMQPGLVVLKPLDRERIASYTFKLTATDRSKIAPLSTGANIHIQIIDENDNEPKFSETSYEISAVENEIGVPLAHIGVSDADSADNGRLAFSFSSLGSVTNEFLRTYLQLIPGENSVVLQLVHPLDYEKIREFHFHLIATDHGRPSKSSLVLIHVRVLNVNDCPPTIRFFIQGQQIDRANPRVVVSEDDHTMTNGAIDRILCHIHVTDDDTDPTDLRCELEPETRSFSLREVFVDTVVNPKKIYELISINMLDRESVAAINILVKCRDGDGLKQLIAQERLQLILSDLNDNVPQFEHSIYHCKVAENLMNAIVEIESSDDKLKFQRGNNHFFAKDKDIGPNALVYYYIMHDQIFNYSGLASGNKSEDVDGTKFVLNAFTGQLRTKSSLDAETQQSYTFKIMAIDQATDTTKRLTATAQVFVKIIDLNDNPPVIEKRKYLFRVKENLPRQTQIGQIKSTDADITEANRITVFELHDILELNVSRMIFIEAHTGRLRTLKPLDREEISEISFVLRARNKPPVDGVSFQNANTNFYDEVAVSVIVEDENDNTPVMRSKRVSGQKLISDLAPAMVDLEYTYGKEKSTANCIEFPFHFTDADANRNGEVTVALESNPYFELRLDNTLLCQSSLLIPPNRVNLAIVVRDSPEDESKMLSRRYVVRVRVIRDAPSSALVELKPEMAQTSNSTLPKGSLNLYQVHSYNPSKLLATNTDMQSNDLRSTRVKNGPTTTNVTTTIVITLVLISGLLCLLLLIVIFALRKTSSTSTKQSPELHAPSCKPTSNANTLDDSLQNTPEITFGQSAGAKKPKSIKHIPSTTTEVSQMYGLAEQINPERNLYSTLKRRADKLILEPRSSRKMCTNWGGANNYSQSLYETCVHTKGRNNCKRNQGHVCGCQTKDIFFTASQPPFHITENNQLTLSDLKPTEIPGFSARDLLQISTNNFVEAKFKTDESCSYGCDNNEFPSRHLKECEVLEMNSKCLDPNFV